MLPALPPELLRPVITQVDDTKTLLSLLVSSRALHEEAERALYATFGTRYVGQKAVRPHSLTRVVEQIPEYKKIGFLNRVIESDRIASYVHTIVIDIGTQLDFLSLLEKALPRMCNLVSFGVLILVDFPLRYLTV
jgi:hypothetical protein